MAFVGAEKFSEFYITLHYIQSNVGLCLDSMVRYNLRLHLVHKSIQSQMRSKGFSSARREPLPSESCSRNGFCLLISSLRWLIKDKHATFLCSAYTCETMTWDHQPNTRSFSGWSLFMDADVMFKQKAIWRRPFRLFVRRLLKNNSCFSSVSRVCIAAHTYKHRWVSMYVLYI